MAGEFLGYGERTGQKEGGAHTADPDGGTYKRTKNGITDRFLIKRDAKTPQNDIAEYLASSIFQTTAPGHGAEIELVQNTSKDSASPTNKNAFLASKYFKNYNDFFKEAGYEDRPTGRETAQATAKIPQYVKKTLKEKDSDGSYKYQGYEKAMVTSLLLGDFSVHSGNLGVIRDKDKKNPNLVRIDFGAAFRELTSDINPFKSIKNHAGFEKNYLLRDHPKKRIKSKEFAAELRAVAKKDLTETIDKAWSNVTANFDAEAMKAFGKQIGCFSPSPDKIKEHFADGLKQRQQSLKDLANEIDISLAMKIENKEERQAARAEAIKKAVEESPQYFQGIVSKSRESQLKVKYDEKTLRLLKQELSLASQRKKMNATLAKETTLEPIAPKAVVPSKVVASKTVAPLVERSVDTIMLASASPKAPERSLMPAVAPKQPVTHVLANSGVDPMILFVREQIIAKQMEIIKNTVAALDPDANILSPERFQNYLKNPPDLVKRDLENPVVKKEFEKAIHQAEIAGYKAFNEKFQDQLQPISWKGPAGAENKSQTVKDRNDNTLCTLTEKTVKTAASFALSNGETANVSSYRTIDFPQFLEGGNGPMHVSLALKDEHGQNMPAKNAVYFTAHYDESGKLMEVTSPAPIKFMGEGRDAVGYIEREGKVYTMPVTQDTYQKMMEEVAINGGMGIDLSQKVEALAKDSVVITKPIAEHGGVKPRVLSPELEVMADPPPSSKKRKLESLVESLKEEPLLKKRKVEMPVAPLAAPSPKLTLETQIKAGMKLKKLPEIESYKPSMNPKKEAKRIGNIVSGKTEDQIDKMLSGKNPEEVVTMLKDQIKQNRSEVIKLIVDATNSGRKDKPAGVPTLTKENYHEAYEYGMHEAGKAKTIPAQRLKHVASQKLAAQAGVDPEAHVNRIISNNQKAHQQGMGH